MMPQSRFLNRLPAILVLAALVGLTGYGLFWVNAQMTVRYQAIGIVNDTDGNPLEGVRITLFLTPPGTKSSLPEARSTTSGTTGLQPGISNKTGVFIVRATGRTGAARALRIGIDASGRPPFEIAWLVLHKDGYQDITRTLSILNWSTAPQDWGNRANRIPRLIMIKEHTP